MITKRLLLLLIGSWILILTGCGGSSSYDKKRNETRAMSFLKKFQTANSLYQVEYGSYASLKKLYEDGSSGAIDREFYQALDDHSSSIPVSGYFFSSIDKEQDGDKLDFSERTGLCAYPEKPGESGDLIICILADPRHFKAEPMEGGFVSHGEEWTFYTGDYKKLGRPLKKWPSDTELENNFIQVKKRNPTQALQEARAMAEQARK